jgi:lipoprotein-releasing system ATP-binding protein
MLRATNIHKAYILGRTELPVLRGVSLDVRKGEFLAITGASGSGKSTLLYVMSGLDIPQRGQVLFDGRELFEPEGARRFPAPTNGAARSAGRGGITAGSTTADGKAARPATHPTVDVRLLQGHRNHTRNVSFGFVFQFYHLLPEFDVLENVLLPQMVGKSMGGWLADRSGTADRALGLLDRVGLSGRLSHRPNELSGGERQRVAIARALINDPAVLFADEPTGNLDRDTGQRIFNLLKDLSQSGRTLVMVTHDRDLARQAGRVVQLVDGRLE